MPSLCLTNSAHQQHDAAGHNQGARHSRDRPQRPVPRAAARPASTATSPTRDRGRWRPRRPSRRTAMPPPRISMTALDQREPRSRPRCRERCGPIQRARQARQQGSDRGRITGSPRLRYHVPAGGVRVIPEIAGVGRARPVQVDEDQRADEQYGDQPPRRRASSRPGRSSAGRCAHRSQHAREVAGGWATGTARVAAGLVLAVDSAAGGVGCVCSGSVRWLRDRGRLGRAVRVRAVGGGARTRCPASSAGPAPSHSPVGPSTITDATRSAGCGRRRGHPDGRAVLLHPDPAALG